MRTSVKGYSGHCQTAGSAWKRVRAKTIPVECTGSTHDNLLSQLWLYEFDVLVTRQAASDSRTAGCTLASGMCLGWPLIHSMNFPARSRFDWSVAHAHVANHSSPAGRIAVCVGISNAICYSLRLAPGWFSIFPVYTKGKVHKLQTEVCFISQ